MCTCSRTSVLDDTLFILFDDNCIDMSSLFYTYSHCSFVHNLHFVRLPVKNKAITKKTSPCPKKEGVEDGQTTNNAVETCPHA